MYVRVYACVYACVYVCVYGCTGLPTHGLVRWSIFFMFGHVDGNGIGNAVRRCEHMHMMGMRLVVM